MQDSLSPNSTECNLFPKPTDGHFGCLTITQSEALEELKSEIKSLAIEVWKYDISIFDDYEYLRFLRARKFDVKKTLEMFIKYATWRMEEEVDNILVNLLIICSLLNTRKLMM